MSTWKKLNNYPDHSVSDEGQVRNDKTGTVYKSWLDSNGYPSIHIGKDIKRIHSLVAETFIPNPYDLHEVNHIDGNKANNNKDNLEWISHSRNVLHAYMVHGGHTTREKAVLCIETSEVYKNATVAAKAVGRSPAAIKKCLYGQTNTCADLHWRYCYDYENGSDPGGEGYDLWLCKSRWEEYYGIPEELCSV